MLRGRSHREKCSLTLLYHVEHTHFITLSLCQARVIKSENGYQTYVPGDDIIYGQAYDGFIRSLSKQFASKSAWARNKTLLRNAGAIEGGANGKRNHIHLIIAKPEDVTDEKFRMAICRAAAGNPWIMNGDHAVNIQTTEDASETINQTFYSMKRGTDRLC